MRPRRELRCGNLGTMLDIFPHTKTRILGNDKRSLRAGCRTNRPVQEWEAVKRATCGIHDEAVPDQGSDPCPWPRSGKEPMMISRLPDEPKGWRKLHAQALREWDSNKLDELIQRLNALVTEHRATE